MPVGEGGSDENARVQQRTRDTTLVEKGERRASAVPELSQATAR